MAQEMEIVLDTGARLRVVAQAVRVWDEDDPPLLPVAQERTWYLDGEEIPEWAGVTLVQMMLATRFAEGGT
jgi:hypothetical protein